MPAHPAHAIKSFTTRELPESDRFDFWMSVLSSSLWQVTGWTDVAPGFNVDVREASLGSLSIIQECWRRPKFDPLVRLVPTEI